MDTSRFLLGYAGLLAGLAGLAPAAVGIRRALLLSWGGTPARLAETVIGTWLALASSELSPRACTPG